LVKQQTHPQFEFYIMVASFFDVIVHLFGFFYDKQPTQQNKNKNKKRKSKNKKTKNKKQKTKNKKQKTKTKQTKLTLSLLSFFQEKELCLVFLFRPDYVLNQDPHVI